MDLAPVGEGSVLGDVLDVDPVGLEPPIGPHLLVVSPVPLGESPLLRDVDLKRET